MAKGKRREPIGFYSDDLGLDDKGHGDHFQRAAAAIEGNWKAGDLTLFERIDLQIKLMQTRITHHQLNELCHHGTMLEIIANGM